MSMQLTDLERPFVVTSVASTDFEETVATIKRAEYAGARAFEIHLPFLSFPDRERLAELTEVTAAPMYATCRRGRFYDLLGLDVSVEMTDAERTDALVQAVEAGFNGVDFELDTFDPTGVPDLHTTDAIVTHASKPDVQPAQVSDDETAITRQRELLDRIHDAGGEAIVSAHTYTHLEPDEAVEIAARVTERGGDFAKIVGVDRDMEQALETLRSHLRLNEADTVPYALMAIGEPSRVIRPISPMFGSAWVFAQPELIPGGFHAWPLVENAREILRRVDWRSAYNPHTQ